MKKSNKGINHFLSQFSWLYNSSCIFSTVQLMLSALSYNFFSSNYLFSTNCIKLGLHCSPAELTQQGWLDHTLLMHYQYQFSSKIFPADTLSSKNRFSTQLPSATAWGPGDCLIHLCLKEGIEHFSLKSLSPGLPNPFAVVAENKQHGYTDCGCRRSLSTIMLLCSFHLQPF